MSSGGNASRNGKDPGRRAANIKHKQQRLLLLYHSAKCSHKGSEPCKVTQYCSEMKKLWRHMEDCKEDRCRFPHCFSSRAILTHYSKCKNRLCLTCEPVRSTLEGNSSHRSARSQPSHNKQPGCIPGFHSVGMFRQGAVCNGRKEVDVRPPSSSPHRSPAVVVESVARTNNEADSLSTIIPPAARRPLPPKMRNKQQRLLLLWHASMCQNSGGGCPITSHCATMKKLWEHMGTCNKQQCDEPHCMSSRSILSHYRRCKDARCLMCGPVRERVVWNARLSLHGGQGVQQPQTAGTVRHRITTPNEEVENSVRRPAKRQKLNINQPATAAGVTDGASCSICYDEGNNALLRYFSLCFHRCCCDCAVQWVQETSSGYRRVPTCPFCRIDLSREDVKAILLQPTLRPTIIGSSSGTEKDQEHEQKSKN